MLHKLSCLIRRNKTANGDAEVYQDNQTVSQEAYLAQLNSDQAAALEYNIALFEEKIIPHVAIL